MTDVVVSGNVFTFYQLSYMVNVRNWAIQRKLALNM